MEIRFELLPLPNYFTAPTHPHATDAAVYTALFTTESPCLGAWQLIVCLTDPLEGLTNLLVASTVHWGPQQPTGALPTYWEPNQPSEDLST